MMEMLSFVQAFHERLTQRMARTRQELWQRPAAPRSRESFGAFLARAGSRDATSAGTPGARSSLGEDIVDILGGSASILDALEQIGQYRPPAKRI